MGTGEEESISFFSILATGKHRLRFTTCLCQASRISQTCIFHANIKLSPPFFFPYWISLSFFFLIKVYLIFRCTAKWFNYIYIYSVKFSRSFVSDSLWPHGLQHNGLPCPSPTSKLTQTHVDWVTDAILCCPISSSVVCFSYLPSFRVFSNESALHIWWPKYWSFSFSNSPSNEYSGLISFRTDWLDLLAVQGTLKCLLQHHSSKASILQHSAFLIVQLSYPYITTGKNHRFD